MKTIVTETSFETNTLLVLQLLLKFSSNILQIEYQMLVLAHTDFMKYEATCFLSRFVAIFYKMEASKKIKYFKIKNSQE